MNFPNAITTFRLLLACFVFYFLFKGLNFYTFCFFLTVFVIFLDYLDGLAARFFKQSSEFGSWFDIAADRAVEIGYWIVFSSLGWVNPLIPLIFVFRGIFVNGIRSFALAKGMTAFGGKTMMKSGIGVFLVSSRFSRVLYAVMKAICFSGVIAAQKFPELNSIIQILIWLTTALCILRGLPVLIEGKNFLNE